MSQNNELSHHGIPGMRWGVRRFQNKDGSLKPAGRKRMINSMGKENYDKTRNKFKNKKSSDQNTEKPIQKKSIKDMTNEELKEKTTRLRLENDFTREINNYNTLHPQKVSKGREFVSKLWKDTISPAASEAGKRLLSDYMQKAGKEALGLNERDPFDKLKREVEILEYENRKTDALSKRKKKVDPLASLKTEVDELELKKRKKKAEEYLGGKIKN